MDRGETEKGRACGGGYGWGRGADVGSGGYGWGCEADVADEAGESSGDRNGVFGGEQPAAVEEAVGVNVEERAGGVHEVLRVERAYHEFGVLNLFPRMLSDGERCPENLDR